MRKLWLLFAQAFAIAGAAALVFLLATGAFESGRVGGRSSVVTVQQRGAPADASNAARASFSSAVKIAVPSVVNIYTTKEAPSRLAPFMRDPALRRYFGEDPRAPAQRATSLGSGVVVSEQGYILTNNHVVEDADQVAVLFASGQQAQARIVGTDPETDLAVLNVDAKNLRPITFGNADAIEVGDVVLAIGNPFGVGQTVTQGIVSATGRNRVGINTFENFIQTDAAINPGNSGGALVDIDGNLIGINSAILSPSGGSLGIGFAIPVSLAKQVMEQIIQKGGVERGWIGVEALDVTPDLVTSLKLPSTKGSFISGILIDGPADQGHMEAGDLVSAVNGKPVEDTAALINATAAIPPGQVGELTVIRRGKEITLRVTVAKRPIVRRPEQ